MTAVSLAQEGSRSQRSPSTRVKTSLDQVEAIHRSGNTVSTAGWTGRGPVEMSCQVTGLLDIVQR